METHLSIARILREKAFSEEVEKSTFYPDELFTIAHHLNLSSDLIAKLPEDQPERFIFIDIAYEAAEKAKQVSAIPSSSFVFQLFRLFTIPYLYTSFCLRFPVQTSALQSATALLRMANKLLPPDSITRHYSLTFKILSLLAECEYSCGHHAAAELLFDFLAQHAATSTDKVRALIIAAVSCESSGNAPSAVDYCLQALAACEILISIDVSMEEVLKCSQEVMALQKGITGTNERLLFFFCFLFLYCLSVDKFNY